MARPSSTRRSCRPRSARRTSSDLRDLTSEISRARQMIVGGGRGRRERKCVAPKNLGDRRPPPTHALRLGLVVSSFPDPPSRSRPPPSHLLHNDPSLTGRRAQAAWVNAPTAPAGCFLPFGSWGDRAARARTRQAFRAIGAIGASSSLGRKPRPRRRDALALLAWPFSVLRVGWRGQSLGGSI